jgi:hypothetical protein
VGERATRAAGARVLAIEPIPGTFAWLARNIAVSGLGGCGRRHGFGWGLGGFDVPLQR